MSRNGVGRVTKTTTKPLLPRKIAIQMYSANRNARLSSHHLQISIFVQRV
jgi:hypothetical protein